MNMELLAIDPGPVESAFVRWTGDGSLLEFGKIPNKEMLRLLNGCASYVVPVCEMIASYGMPVGAEVFETCVWIGRFAQAAQTKMHRITRGKVKMHLCQSMRAKDSNIRQAIIDRLGPPGTKKAPGTTYGTSGDVWAALAVALAFADGVRCPDFDDKETSAVINPQPTTEPSLFTL